MKLWKGLLPALLLLALVATMPAAAAPPAGPPTLTGETLSASNGGGGVRCTNTGSFSFTVSGAAAGPYTGTFTESVTGTVNPVYTLATFTADVTIHSATGDVTGTKTFSGPSPTICYQSTDSVAALGAIPTTYQATIHTANGNYTDHGTSGTSGSCRK